MAPGNLNPAVRPDTIGYLIKNGAVARESTSYRLGERGATAEAT
ncbi:MAG: hypothetical protein ACLTZH_13960 [Subdoligranulum sp.]